MDPPREVHLGPTQQGRSTGQSATDTQRSAEIIRIRQESESIFYLNYKQQFHMNLKAWGSEKLGDDFKHEVLGVLTHRIQKKSRKDA
jgi:hypothetical protein